MEEETTSSGRSKRQKLDKHGRFAALEKLKQLKGTKNKCVVDEVKNVYDEVDEREYSKRVLSRQEDDWIVDDGGGGYVEDGREIFDDEQEDEGANKTSTRKSKSSKKPAVENLRPSGGGNIQSLLANMPTKKKVTQTKVNPDELLDNLMGEIEKVPSAKKPVVSSKEYLKSFTNRPSPARISTEIKPKPATIMPKPAIKRRKSPSPVPVRRALITEYSQGDNDSGANLSCDDICSETVEPVNSQVSISETKSGMSDSLIDDQHLADINMDDFDEPMTITTPEVLENTAEVSPEIVASWFDDDFEDSTAGSANGSVADASLVLDKSSVPLTTNEKGEQVFRFFWWDAYEDPFNQPGNVYLLGKVFVEKLKKHVSCCVVVSNIPRRVFLLPREKKFDDNDKETDETVTFIDLFKEFNEKVANKRKIMKFKSRKVVKKYAFDLPDVPAESEYLEVKYPANHERLPADLKGQTFSRVFGTTTGALEIFLLEQQIKGPCWLDVRAPQKSATVSWCQLEISCTAPDHVTVLTHAPPPPPPLNVLALNVRTVLNTRTMQNEVVMVSFLTHSKYMIDKHAPSPPYESAICAFTRPTDTVWPVGLKPEIAKFKGKVIQHESERSLLSFVLTKIFQLDPDLIVGHDLYGFTLDTIIHRVEHYKVANWSRIGRLRRATVPQRKGKGGDRHLVSGRLVCDTMKSARELIRARSYDLDTLSKQVLKLPEDKRQDHTSEEVKSMFGQCKSLITLVNATMQDAVCALRLMYELNVLPLALQITNIAGNVMSGTLLGGRSERNEFLLLHAFTEKEFIVPDKIYGKKKVDEDGEVVEPSKRKKADYAGGLVLEPKKGFYDKFILLMDFNSLYPSIIQEYNICFTTVTRSTDSNVEPELPPSGLPLGILPIEIRKLVESRRQVKTLMKSPDLAPDLRMQYNIRQTALKLTANSMYGCLGFGFSRFYAKPLAALVTSRGRDILMNTRDVVQRMNFEVIYGDTDSIMINTNVVDYEQVFGIGNKIKQEINKLYKHVELEVDGVFKYMLLLKKKKYAAVVLSKSTTGHMIETQEYKGLDIVRRDWSRLSAEIGEFVLQQILSSKSPDERVDAIRSQLEKVAGDLKAGVVPIALLAITKQLAKNPEDYPDRKSLPHLQVAMRVNAKGGKKLKQGDTVSYVICDDGTNESAVQRAYHIDELKENDKLIIDVNYYLTSQIHPVVSRLCEPIDGLDGAFIAECLGLDPTSYKRAAAKVIEDQDDDDDCIVDDLQYFKHCEKLSFTCPNEDCLTTITMDGPLYDNYLVLSRCRNPNCNTPPTEYLPRVQNALQLSIRSFQKKLYTNWVECEDPACTNKTRRIPMEFANCFPVCRLCGKGLMYRTYHNSDLYYQLKFYAYMFNYKTTKRQTTSVVENAYKILYEQVEKVLARSAYRIVDLSKVFNFAINNSRPKLSASQQTIVDLHNKLANL